MNYEVLIERRQQSALNNILIVGDFNLAANSKRYKQAKQAKQSLQDLPVVTWPNMFASKLWGIGIDHLWASGDLAIKSRRSETLFNSDHLAVLSEICFVNNQQ